MVFKWKSSRFEVQKNSWFLFSSFFFFFFIFDKKKKMEEFLFSLLESSYLYFFSCLDLKSLSSILILNKRINLLFNQSIFLKLFRSKFKTNAIEFESQAIKKTKIQLIFHPKLKFSISTDARSKIHSWYKDRKEDELQSTLFSLSEKIGKVISKKWFDGKNQKLWSQIFQSDVPNPWTSEYWALETSQDFTFYKMGISGLQFRRKNFFFFFFLLF